MVHIYVRMANIIVATDSRGRQLTTYINTHLPFKHNTQFTPILIPGATKENIHQAIVFHLQQTEEQLTLQHTSITVSACICNLTQKNHHKGGTEISYEHSQDNIENLIENMQRLKHIQYGHNNTSHYLNTASITSQKQDMPLSNTQTKAKHIHRQRHTITAPTTPTRYPAHQHSHF